MLRTKATEDASPQAWLRSKDEVLEANSLYCALSSSLQAMHYLLPDIHRQLDASETASAGVFPIVLHQQWLSVVLACYYVQVPEPRPGRRYAG